MPTTGAPGLSLETGVVQTLASRARSDYDLRTMSDFLEHQKEWFSRAFLTAVAASAGYPVEITLNDLFAVDATVRDGGVAVDWQLKGTASPDFTASELRFDLDVRAYDLLRGPRNAPAYLGVVVVPEDVEQWVNQNSLRLILRHCGYWVKLTGMPPTTNTTKKRIHIPLENVLCAGDLSGIMADERGRLTA